MCSTALWNNRKSICLWSRIGERVYWVHHSGKQGRQWISGVTKLLIMVSDLTGIFGDTSPSDLFRIQLRHYSLREKYLRVKKWIPSHAIFPLHVYIVLFLFLSLTRPKICSRSPGIVFCHCLLSKVDHFGSITLWSLGKLYLNLSTATQLLNKSHTERHSLIYKYPDLTWLVSCKFFLNYPNYLLSLGFDFFPYFCQSYFPSFFVFCCVVGRLAPDIFLFLFYLAPSSSPPKFLFLFILSPDSPICPLSVLLFALQFFVRPSGILDRHGSQIHRAK